MKQAFLFLIILVSISSCSDDDNDDYLPLDNKKEILSFSIQEYPELIFTGLNQNVLETTLQEYIDVTSLTAVFKISPKAKVYIDGVQQIAGETVNDFNEKIEYTIEAEDGSSTIFSVEIHPVPNELPIALAGQDQWAVIETGGDMIDLLLDGSDSSDPDDEELLYEWSIDDTIIGSSEITLVSLPRGNYTITLTVTDGFNAKDSDSIRVQVLELGDYAPIDPDASIQARNILNNLGTVMMSEQFAFGQEFPLSFQLNSLSYDLETSDCKDVTGDHPAVFGIDPHYMLYKDSAQRKLHIDEAKKAFENGSIVTFDFHQKSRIDGEIYFNNLTSETDKSLMYDIVNDRNDSRLWYFNELDEIIDIINNDLSFTVIFRLFHEMNGSWFWWGTQGQNHSPDLYVEFYRLTVNYIKERTNHVLFGWSPDQSLNTSYYPGDSYVDVIGIDFYAPSQEKLKQELIELTSFATSRNKIAALTETGYPNYHSEIPNFWTEKILSTLTNSEDQIRVAWVLSWFNAPWNSSQSDLFIPNSDSPQYVKDDFIWFKNDSHTLFQEDFSRMKIYNKFQAKQFLF